MKPALLACGLALLAAPALASAQSLGFGGNGSTPQPIHITAQNGIAWNQKSRTVTAMGDAKAVRGKVTVTADRLIAHYHPKKTDDSQKAAKPKTGATGSLGGLESGASQITQLDAVGHVHIFTATDQAFADRAVYHMDIHELVLTGKHLKLTTPTETVTARDAIQYWSVARKAVAIGKAVITSKDGRSITADRLTGYFVASQPGTAAASQGTDAEASKLRKVIADGHVLVRTATDVATGDHGVYHPATGIAILTGNVHITHGPNELAGAKAEVNLKTGLATLIAAPGRRVEGLVIPDSSGNGTSGTAPKSPQSGSRPAQ